MDTTLAFAQPPEAQPRRRRMMPTVGTQAPGMVPPGTEEPPPTGALPPGPPQLPTTTAPPPVPGTPPGRRPGHVGTGMLPPPIATPPTVPPPTGTTPPPPIIDWRKKIDLKPKGPDAFALPTVGDKFGPGNDLRFNTLYPGANDFKPMNTDVTRSAVNPNIGYQAVGTNVDAGPAVNPTDSPELAKARGLQMGAADAIATGPNRQKIAEDRLASFDMQAQPQMRDQIRDVGQRAAALGRIGNGQTSIEALTPYTDYLTKRASLSKDLAAETAAGDISDRQNNLSAFRGLTESTAGLDTSKRGEQRTERSNVQNTEADNLARQMAERNAKTSLDERNNARAVGESDADFAARTANVNRATTERNAVAANAQSNRDELRGERGYQTDTAKGATEDAIRQHLLEGQDANTDFDQQLRLLALANGGDPTAALLGGARNSASSAADSYESFQKLLTDYYRRNQTQ